MILFNKKTGEQGEAPCGSSMTIVIVITIPGVFALRMLCPAAHIIPDTPNVHSFAVPQCKNKCVAHSGTYAMIECNM